MDKVFNLVFSLKLFVSKLFQLSYALCTSVCLLSLFHQLDCSAGHGEGFKFVFFYKSA